METGKNRFRVMREQSGNVMLVEGYNGRPGIYNITNDLFIINPEETMFFEDEILEIWENMKIGAPLSKEGCDVQGNDW